ncbi:DUF7847 domain-containing protein [Halogeometricum limi]|uniref:DUF7847 domain-containing protein n=1 Tax=Halogeometricum limi TaxID=555875 RepID=A0A1I6GX81_9EURY|nr:hypothetical protein [Halogeometricum limi]SFR46679.1 hypothetical protein SAMN04488124_1641 [Halogeometricum limi]
MAALQSLRTALGSLGRNPVLFLGGLAYALVILPQTATQLAGIPVAPTLLQILTFFVTPFFLAGVIGMAGEALNGDTSLPTLRRVGKNRYVPLLVANFVEFVLVLAIAIVGLIVVAISFVLASTSGAPGPVLAAVVGLVVLVALAISFFIQFFPVAIALGDADAIGGFKESVGLVRRNLLSTLGYSVISLVVTVVTIVPTVGATLYPVLSNVDQLQEMQQSGMDQAAASQMAAFQLSTTEVVLVSAISLATTMLLFTFQQTYATAFYRAHRPRTDDGDSPAESDVRTSDTGASANSF